MWESTLVIIGTSAIYANALCKALSDDGQLVSDALASAILRLGRSKVSMDN